MYFPPFYSVFQYGLFYYKKPYLSNEKNIKKSIKIRKKGIINEMKNNELKKEILIGIFAGIINGMFSIGGGLILVPAFTYILKKSEAMARATSLFCVLPFVILSGINFLTEKIIDWNLSIKCAIGGIIGGIIGAKLLKKLSPQFLKIIFSVFLIGISVKMLVL